MGAIGTTKLSYKKVKEIVNDLGSELISEKYNGARSKIIVKDSDGFFYYSVLFNIINNKNSPFVGKGNPFSIQNIKLWCQLNNKTFVLLSKEYINNSTYMQWKCIKEDCKEDFESTWANISVGHGCPFCSGKKASYINCLETKYEKTAKEWHPMKNEMLTPRDVTPHSKKVVWWICEEGHEWKARVDHRTRMESGCPACAETKGEKRVRIYLEKNNIELVAQKEFHGLVGLGGKPLAFDFYLPSFDLLIEYQGEFHDGSGGTHTKDKESLERTKKHDQIKKEFAKHNNIKILEIWHWDYDNIEKVLQETLIERIHS